MKAGFLLLAMTISGFGQNAADIPPNPLVPASPRKFTTRSIGGGAGVGVGVREMPRERTKGETKKFEYIAVSELRVWTSADGRKVRAAMLAYEPGPVPKDSSKPLTLVRDGKIRLLLEKRKQVTDLALVKLSEEDQAFVKEQVEARKKASEESGEKTGKSIDSKLLPVTPPDSKAP